MAFPIKGSTRFTRILIGTYVVAAVTQATAGDWPTYRGDVRRSGVSADTLRFPLVEGWRHQPEHAPDPAWPESPAKLDVYRKVGLSPTVTFDRAFQPVIADGRLYHGSSADDAVWCLDAKSGEMLWVFATEGPVRLAPTISKGRIYFGSDDGCVYCLRAADGSLVWRHRAVEPDRRLPGNGRMISLWPVRSSVAVDNGRAYFTAGLFPSQGAFLCAVDAATGKPEWKRQVDISPQGYLLASTSHLFVPTGRAAPHVYRRDDGEQVAPFPGGGQQRAGFPQGGGCFGILLEDSLVHAGGEKGGLEFIGAKNREKIITAPGIRLVARGEVAYILDVERLRAIHRARYVELNRLMRKKEKTPEDEERIAALQSPDEPAVLWEVSCSAPYAMILAGEHLLCGGDGHVVAYDAADGTKLWQGPVDGKAYALAVADETLYVGTDKGTIHSFADGQELSPQPALALEDANAADKRTSWWDGFPELLGASAAGQGYCLWLGMNREFEHDLRARHQLQMVCVEPLEKEAIRWRRHFVEHGQRIAIHHHSLKKLPYQDKTFNLIVGSVSTDSREVPTPAEEVFRLLRPCGGIVAVFGTADPESKQTLVQWGRDTIPGWTVEALGDRFVGHAQRGPLEGAGQWTHFYGDPGNSACSGDSLEFGPVDIQWFGRPGPRRMVDRHEKNMAPLYKDGRMFITGDNYVVAVDAYNGTVLWQRDVPESIRLGAFKNCGSMAVGQQCLYVASADTCLALDVRTGNQQNAFTAPKTSDNRRGEWGYVATVDNLLFGSTSKPGANWRIQDVDTQNLIWRDYQPVVTSDVLFAIDVESGKTAWSYRPTEGVIVNPTLAAGDGRVYCVESANQATFDVPDGRIKLDALFAGGARLVALDMRSGEVVWRKPVDLSKLEHVVFLSYAQETLVISGSRNVLVPGSEKRRVRYDLWAIDAPSGKLLWNSTETPLPDHILQGPHGEQVQHPTIVGDVIYSTGFARRLRSGQPYDGWKWSKSEKCGTISASASCVFSRFVTPRMFSLDSGEYLPLTQVTRPGCWINILPAGGLVLIPEASSGCTCYFSLQTSVALAPR